MMKIKIFLMVAFSVALSGCASTYSSIEQAEADNTYYVTEIYARPFGLSSDLLVCEAEGTTKMLCESID